VITIGLDAGGSAIKGVRLEGERIAAELRRPHHGVDLIGLIVAAAAELSTPDVEAVGVGLAGLVRHPGGEFVWGPHLPLFNVETRPILEEKLALPVAVDNDANLAALAESRMGVARDRSHVLVLSFGSGIGGGLILGGRVYRGTSFAGEVGHMRLTEAGDLCACGNRGCWETLVSGSVLDRAARRILDRNATGEDLVAAADRGDAEAIAALAEAGRWLGIGVANLVAVLDPELVVVGGAAAQAGEWLLEPARMAMRENLRSDGHRPLPRVVRAGLGPIAAAIGAAILAGEEYSGDNDGDE
jgi:glucokinase